MNRNYRFMPFICPVKCGLVSWINVFFSLFFPLGLYTYTISKWRWNQESVWRSSILHAIDSFTSIYLIKDKMCPKTLIALKFQMPIKLNHSNFKNRLLPSRNRQHSRKLLATWKLRGRHNATLKRTMPIIHAHHSQATRRQNQLVSIVHRMNR